MSHPNASAANGVILDLGEGLTVREYRLSDAKTMSHHANNKKLWLQLRDRFPHPYTEESAVVWINGCLDEGDCVRSGPWTYENGASGPLTSTHYAIAVNDEVCGSIGLDFGSGTVFRERQTFQPLTYLHTFISTQQRLGIGCQKNTGAKE